MFKVCVCGRPMSGSVYKCECGRKWILKVKSNRYVFAGWWK